MESTGFIGLDFDLFANNTHAIRLLWLTTDRLDRKL